MNRTYKTTQKQIVKSYLEKNTSKHFTVNELTNILNAEQKNIGTTTVYRHLETLAKEGIVQKYKLNKHTCYQLIKSDKECLQHFHLKCSTCGKLLHLECDYLQNIENHLYKDHSFKLNSVQTVFYGYCKQCAKK